MAQTHIRVFKWLLEASAGALAFLSIYNYGTSWLNGQLVANPTNDILLIILAVIIFYLSTKIRVRK